MSRRLKMKLLHNPGLVHAGYQALLDTKQIQAEQPDYSWKRDVVDRDSKVNIVTVMKKPFKDSASDWLGHRHILAQQLGLDLQNPEDLRKVAAFMSAFRQEILSLVPLELNARLHEKLHFNVTQRVYDISHTDGKVLVFVSQPIVYFDSPEQELEMFEQSYSQVRITEDVCAKVIYQKLSDGEIFDDRQKAVVDFLADLKSTTVKAYYELALDPDVKAFRLVDNCIHLVDDVGSANILPKILKHNSIHENKALDCRIDWLKDKHISYALENKCHSDFLSNYLSFLEKLPHTFKKEENAQELLRAAIELAVIEHIHRFQRAVKQLDSAQEIAVVNFQRLLDEYLNIYDKYFHDVPINRDEIKEEMTDAVYELMALYLKYDVRNDKTQHEAVRKVFEDFNQKHKEKLYASVLSRLAESMGDSIVAKRIEQAAFPQLIEAIVEKKSATSTDSAISSDASSPALWSRTPQNRDTTTAESSDDEGEDDVNRRFFKFPNM